MNLLTVKEVAERLQVSSRKAREIVDSKGVPVLRLGERTLRVLESDLDNFINENICQSNQEVNRTSSTLKSDRSELEKLLGVTDKKRGKLKAG